MCTWPGSTSLDISEGPQMSLPGWPNVALLLCFLLTCHSHTPPCFSQYAA
jgi:hypothetical protein